MRRQSARLMHDGEPETWLGVNFWSRVGGPRMWRDYDPDAVGAELDALAEHRLTVTRSFCYWPDFMPTPDAVDPEMVARMRDFLDQHTARGMRSIPTFLVGHMSGQNWDPVWRGERNLFGDVWFVGRQAFYVREVVREFAQHPAVAAWLLTNEVPIFGDWRTGGVGVNDPEQVTAWTQLLIDAARAGGATQPIGTGDGSWGVETSGADNGFRVRDLAPMIDFHGPHVYRMETDAVRQHLGAAFVVELLDLGGKPVVMEEFGVTTDFVGDEHAADYYRQVLHTTLLAGSTGWLGWNNTDYDTLADVEPYSHHPFEMHFGVFRADGSPKAQAVELQRFGELLERVDAPRLSRPESRVALVVPSYLEAQYPFTEPGDATAVVPVARQAYIAAREADLPPAVVRERDGVPEGASLYLLPSAKQFTAPGWARLRALAEGGATVYASAFLGEHGNQRGLWWPDVDQTFGVRRITRYGLADPVVDDELRMRFVAPLGSGPGAIAAGEELVFPVGGNADSRTFLPVQPDGCEVLAVDAHDRPALVRRRAGSGWLVLCTYPVEYFAAVTRDANPEPTHRLYAALAAEAGVTPIVAVDDPRVLVDELVHEDGRVFTWFVSEHAEPQTVRPRVHAGGLVSLDGEAVSEVRLAPYGVEVRERR